MRSRLLSTFGACLLAAACGGGSTSVPASPPATTPPPAVEPTSAAEPGATTAPPKEPVTRFSLYFNGFHASKDAPAQQIEAHHYCNQVSDTFMQCTLFEGSAPDSRLIGIEYIIAEGLYDTLPANERAYWHPHNYAILSAQLRMPGQKPDQEEAALQRLMNSYGKTWQTWNAGEWGRSPDSLPLGPARLQWSFNRDGEASPGMINQRDRRLGFNSISARQQRQELAKAAKPQGGTDALNGLFGARTLPIPGVSDSGQEGTAAVPVITLRDTAPAAPAR